MGFWKSSFAFHVTVKFLLFLRKRLFEMIQILRSCSLGMADFTSLSCLDKAYIYLSRYFI